MEPEGFHFYCIIDPECIQDRRLLIPNNFITNVGCKLSSPALLKVSTGKEWHVELKQHKAQFWFQNGWHEFMEYHSISVLHLLVFRFDGNSRFNVFIFDKTATEIWYPSDIHDSDQLTNETRPQTYVKQENQDEGSLEILYEHPSRKVVAECDDSDSSKHNTKSHFSSCPAAKRQADTTDYVRNKKTGKNVESVTVNNPGTGTPVISSLPEKRGAKLFSKSRRFTSFSQREQAVIAARAFTSIYPFCTVTMKPSHVHGKFIVYLPIAFARSYLNEDIQSVTLWDSDGNTWQVRYFSSKSQVMLTTGWKVFVLDNYLEEDDICVFELVDGKHTALKVTIFKVKDPKLRKGISAQSKMSSCHLGNKGMQNKDIGKKRKVSYSKERIENEEVPFMVDTIDNVDLPNTGEPIIYANPKHSSNSTDEENSSSIQRSVQKRLVANQEEDREIVETTGFASDKPFCIVTMQSFDVQGDFTLNLPKAFATKYLKNAFHGVTLRISNGTCHADFVSGDYCKLYKGWKEFVLDNNVKEGDVCLFELVDRNHMELKVSIEHVLKHSEQEESEVFSYNFQGVAEGAQSNGSKAAKDTIAEDCTKQETSKQELSIPRPKQQAQHVSIPIRHKSLQEKERLIVAARTFTSKNPFCGVTMRHSYVHGHNLTLPNSFSKRYLQKGKENATICGSDGRRRPIRISFGEYNVKLSKGWREFVLDNQLEEDDICIFELVDKYCTELKVTIFRLCDPKQLEAEDWLSDR